MRSVQSAAALLLAACLSLTLGPALAAGGSAARFTSYLGGGGADGARAVAVDSTGATYVVGTTDSADFPVKEAVFGSLSGGTDAYVAKVAADGKSVLWATYLGGSGNDEGLAVAVDASGDVWVAGATASTDFPIIVALQGWSAGGVDGFVSCFNSSGNLLTSTYLGGSGDDRIRSLGFDGAGNAWMAGTTDSWDLPTTWDAFQYYPGGEVDAFAAEISSDGSALLHATYLGGSGAEDGVTMAVEASGNVLLAGSTRSEDLPLVNAVQGYLAGGSDAFAARIDGATKQPTFSTYFGGSDDDAARAVVADADGVLYVAGATLSSDLPASSAYQGSAGGGSDAFLLSLDSNGTSVRFATYLGGSGDDEANAVMLTADGSPVVAGMTASEDFPVRAGSQPSAAGGGDGFVSRLSKSGATMAYSTYLGGSGLEVLTALALDPSGAAVAVGATGSDDLPTLAPFQAATGGGEDGLVSRLLLAPPAPHSLSVGNLSHLQVTLSWVDASGGTASFEIQRSTSGEGFEVVAMLPPGTTSWTDTDVEPQTSYAYRIRAFIDGTPSDFSAEIMAGTLAVPNPVAPGMPALEVLSPRSIQIEWTDNSDDEIKFEVFRAADGGAFSIVKSLPAGVTSWQDNGVSADRTWSYDVRAVSAVGPSSFSPSASAATPANYSIFVEQGKRVDSGKASRDSVNLLLDIQAIEGAGTFDPMAAGIQIGIGDVGSPAFVTVLPGAEGWKVKNGVYTWKSPKGSLSKVKLTVDPAQGTVKVKATRLELPALAAGDLRTWVRCGGDAGSVQSTWLAGKTGVLVSE
jgi:hypothetical protein